jgi:hypothetical protein
MGYDNLELEPADETVLGDVEVVIAGAGAVPGIEVVGGTVAEGEVEVDTTGPCTHEAATIIIMLASNMVMFNLIFIIIFLLAYGIGIGHCTVLLTLPGIFW